MREIRNEKHLKGLILESRETKKPTIFNITGNLKVEIMEDLNCVDCDLKIFENNNLIFHESKILSISAIELLKQYIELYNVYKETQERQIYTKEIYGA